MKGELLSLLTFLALSLSISEPQASLQIPIKTPFVLQAFRIKKGLYRTIGLEIECVSPSNDKVFFEGKDMCGSGGEYLGEELDQILQGLYTVLTHEHTFLEVKFLLAGYRLDNRNNTQGLNPSAPQANSLLSDRFPNPSTPDRITFTQTITPMAQLPLKQTAETITFNNLNERREMAEFSSNLWGPTLQAESQDHWPSSIRLSAKNGRISLRLTQKLKKDSPLSLTFVIRDQRSGLKSSPITVHLIVPPSLFSKPKWVVYGMLAGLGGLLIIVLYIILHEWTTQPLSRSTPPTPQLLNPSTPQHLNPSALSDKVLSHSITKWNNTFTSTSSHLSPQRQPEVEGLSRPSNEVFVREITLSPEKKRQLDLSHISHASDTNDDFLFDKSQMMLGTSAFSS